MKRSKKNRSIIRTGVLALVIAMVVASIAAGSSVWPGDNSAYAAAIENPTGVEEQAEVEKFIITDEGLQIDTQYIRLVYPVEYINDVMINLSEENGKSTICVMASFEGMDHELFSLVLSDIECEGYQMGFLKCADKEIGIYTLMNEMNTENWPEEEIMRFGRLQESVNTLLDQLYSAEGFVSFWQ